MLDFDSILPVRRLTRGWDVLCRFLIRREEYEEFFDHCAEYGIVWNSGEPLSAFDPFEGIKETYQWLDLELHNKTTIDEPDTEPDRFTFTYDTPYNEPRPRSTCTTYYYTDIPILNDAHESINIASIYPEFS